MQEYKAHDRSRESIEMALDEILKQKMKIRHKYGFKPPKSGRRTDVEGDPTVSCQPCLCCFEDPCLQVPVAALAAFGLAQLKMQMQCTEYMQCIKQ